MFREEEGGTRLSKWLSVSALVLLSCVLLTGCTPSYPMAARLDDAGGIELAFCEDFNFTVLTVNERDDGTPADEAVTLWGASGTGVVKEGDVVEWGEPPLGLTNTTEPGALKFDNHQIQVHLERLSSTGVNEVGRFGIFDVDALSPDQWLDQDGRLRDSACG